MNQATIERVPIQEAERILSLFSESDRQIVSKCIETDANEVFDSCFFGLFDAPTHRPQQEQVSKSVADDPNECMNELFPFAARARQAVEKSVADLSRQAALQGQVLRELTAYVEALKSQVPREVDRLESWELDRQASSGGIFDDLFPAELPQFVS